MNSMTTTSGILAIISMHRSGSSLVASLLQSAGLHIGRKVMLYPDDGNPKGYFENFDFWHFHRSVLQSQGIDEDGWTLQEKIEIEDRFLEEAKKIVAQNSLSVLWGWKEPRTALFLDFWAELLPEANFLLIYRAPWEVVDSLYRRQDTLFQQQPEFAVKVWLHYNQKILKFYNSHVSRCLLVNISTIVKDQELYIQEINQRFQTNLTAPASNLYEPSLLHSQGLDSYRPSLIEHYFPEVVQLYQELNSRSWQPHETPDMSWQELIKPSIYRFWAFQDWLSVRKLEKDNKLLGSQLNQSQSQLKETEDLLAQYKPQLKETEDLLVQSQFQLQGTEDLLTQSQLELQKTEDLLAQSQSQLQETEEVLVQSQSQLIETEEVLTHLQSQLIETEEVLTHLQSQLIETEEVLVQSQSRLIETEEVLVQSQSQLIETEEVLAQSQSQLIETRDSWIQSCSQLQETEEVLVQSQSQLQETEEVLLQYQSRLSQCQAELQESQAQLHDVESLLEEYKDRLQQANAQLEQSQFELQQSHREKQEAKDQADVLEEILHQSQSQLKQTESSLEISLSQLLQLQKELEISHSRHHETKRELKQLQSQHYETQEELEQCLLNISQKEALLEQYKTLIDRSTFQQSIDSKPKENSKIQYELLVSEAWSAYQTGAMTQMQDRLRQSLKYSPFSPTHTISDWLESFAKLAMDAEGHLDTVALTNLTEWKQLMRLVLSMKPMAIKQ